MASLAKYLPIPRILKADTAAGKYGKRLPAENRGEITRLARAMEEQPT